MDDRMTNRFHSVNLTQKTKPGANYMKHNMQNNSENRTVTNKVVSLLFFT